jgi:hypothetical protein
MSQIILNEDGTALSGRCVREWRDWSDDKCTVYLYATQMPPMG